jgi:hypothetical protein
VAGYDGRMSEMEPKSGIEGANEADVAEQNQSLGDVAPDERPDATTEATEADVQEQRQDP